MSAITLTLLLPGKAVPVQNWTFSSESLIRIGRATDNNVILYSAVVSRHHLELRHGEQGWEAVNIGANGTYVDGQSISSVPVIDGMIIRLASSGPKIQVHLDAHARPPLPEQIHTPRRHAPEEKPVSQTLISSN